MSLRVNFLMNLNYFVVDIRNCKYWDWYFELSFCYFEEMKRKIVYD